MEHPALKNLYEEVVSGKFSWERWGLLSVLADYCLFFNKGDILEIGTGESSIHFSKLAEKYNRKCYHCDYSRSGMENLKNTNGYFGNNSITYTGKSDDFFNETKLTPISFAFIDGDHTYEAAKNDFNNTLKYLVNGGMIALHDSYPPTKEWLSESKCGTVNKLRIELEERRDLEIFTFKNSAFDVGLSLVQKRNVRDW
jgi:predicted O-methyltransferase YrrM